MKFLKVLLVIGSAALGVGAVLLVSSFDGSGDVDEGGVEVSEDGGETTTSPSKNKPVKLSQDIGNHRGKNKLGAPGGNVGKPSLARADDEFSPKDRKTVDAIQAALDAEDLKQLMLLIKDAASSTNAAVRAKAVDALQWFGDKGLEGLTHFMADDDDEVRSAAVDAYTTGASQIESENERSEAVLMGMRVVKDRDQLEAMVMQVDGMEDASKVDTLVRAISGGSKEAAEVARAHYEFVTGEKYSGRAAAQKWLRAQSEEDAQPADEEK